MNPDRWRQVDGLVKAAMERTLAEREAFVSRECHGDEALEKEVRSGLNWEGQAGSLRETAVPAAGQIVLHYRTTEKLSRGGMGVVLNKSDQRCSASPCKRSTQAA